MAEVVVDGETGAVRVLRVVAAHDVGRVVNPTLLEGQIEGAVAQGVGMALMAHYRPGVNNNLHDYLIPTVHDVPTVKCLFVEAATDVGPFGAKGIGEPALVPTAAAILNAIHDASGARIRVVPATPEIVSEALRERRARPGPEFACRNYYMNPPQESIVSHQRITRRAFTAGVACIGAIGALPVFAQPATLKVRLDWTPWGVHHSRGAGRERLRGHRADRRQWQRLRPWPRVACDDDGRAQQGRACACRRSLHAPR
jgi:hypothetical protein